MLLCHGWLSAGYHINWERIQTPAIWNLTSLRHHLSCPRPVRTSGYQAWWPCFVTSVMWSTACFLFSGSSTECCLAYCGSFWPTSLQLINTTTFPTSVYWRPWRPGLRSGWKHLRRGQLTATSRWCAAECLQRAYGSKHRKQLCVTGLERNTASGGPKYTHWLDQRDQVGSYDHQKEKGLL